MAHAPPSRMRTDDGELLRLLYEEPARAMRQILERYDKLLRHVVHHFCYRDEDREELLQEVALTLLEDGPRRLQKWDPGRSAFTSYLYLVSYRICLNCLRKVQREKRWETNPGSGNPDYEEGRATADTREASDNPRKRAALSEAVDQLKACFDLLLKAGSAREEDRPLVGMRAEGVPAEEVGRLLGLKKETVHVRYGRLKERLRKCLADHGFRSLKDLLLDLVPF